MKEKLDLVTTDFVYVRWLGDRKGIEALTRTWDKTIIDRTDDLRNWAGLWRRKVALADVWRSPLHGIPS